ncbi:MAG: VOC family protein [Chlorobiales bacterium]|nr:VOC family protein [Chlorobiales bacterium]
MKAKSLFPITITNEIKLCRDYYLKFFDFEVIFEADWYIQLKHASGIELAFMLPDLQNQPGFLHGSYSGNGVVLSFEVDDAEKEYARIKELGADIAYDLKDEEWGQRHFMVKDPSGMVLDIVQQL